jgi:class 3 adenylate cyclase
MDAPPIQYARTEDGVNIAYWSLGEGPPLLILNRPVNSHLELEWHVPSIRAGYEALARKYEVIRYDPRSAGLSDRDTSDMRLDTMAAEVASVLTAVQSDPVAILSEWHMSRVAIALATQHAELVRAMVLVHADARQSAQYSAWKIAGPAIAEANPENWVELTAGGMDPNGVDPPGMLKALIRSAVDWDPPTFRARMEAYETWDVVDVLNKVVVPTLIVHYRDDPMNPIAIVRELAAAISESRVVVREGKGQFWYDEDVDSFRQTIEDFLDRDQQLPIGVADSAATPIRTILFTDLESSTALTQAVGDAKAQDVLHGHNDVVRAALAAHNGEEVKHTGDGIMASFGSAVSAVEAALAIQRDLAGGEIRVRIGLNAGEPIAEDHDYFGTAVQLAARICDRAEPGQVLVSNVVRELCAGKTFTFEDVGAATLKGFAEPVALYAVGVS